MGRQPRGEEYGRLVLQTIRDIRKEHHACTSREIGRRLQVPHQLINRQLELLRKLGLVDWTSMPGGIWLTLLGGRVANGTRMPELPRRAAPAKVKRVRPSSTGGRMPEPGAA